MNEELTGLEWRKTIPLHRHVLLDARWCVYTAEPVVSDAEILSFAMYFSTPVRVMRASCLVSRRLVSYLDTPRLGSWSNVTCQAYPREDDRYSRQAPRELKLLEFSYHRKRILNSLSPRSLMCCIQRNRQHHCRGLVRAAHLRSQFSGCFTPNSRTLTT